MLQFTVNHAGLVELAHSEIHPRVVDSLANEELIQQISAAIHDALQVVTEAMGNFNGSLCWKWWRFRHQAEGNNARGILCLLLVLKIEETYAYVHWWVGRTAVHIDWKKRSSTML
jgi:hypothetical protein